MKFFALDCHIGIVDIKSIFAELGHELVVHSISSHANLMGWEQCNKFIVNNENWRSLSSSNCDSFFEAHHEELSSYDGFVCFYPPSFSMMYEKFQKPIITHVPIRFETPFHRRRHDLFNYIMHLRRTIESGQLQPLANNRFDSEYCTAVVGKKFDHIPSLCDYLNVSRQKINKEVIVHGDFQKIAPTMPGLKRLQSGYSWNELYSYNAIVHIPYHNSLMSMFEQYAANMPLLVPSDDFMIELWKKDSRSIMSQISWHSVENLGSERVYQIDKNLDVNLYDDVDVMRNAISLSDWNDKDWMPHVIKFDSWEHLEELIQADDFDSVHEAMKSDSGMRKEKILRLWENVFRRIS